jgi:hypothetical protein
VEGCNAACACDCISVCVSLNPSCGAVARWSRRILGSLMTVAGRFASFGKVKSRSHLIQQFAGYLPRLSLHLLYRIVESHCL